jgi:hypothetical protein
MRFRYLVPAVSYFVILFFAISHSGRETLVYAGAQDRVFRGDGLGQMAGRVVSLATQPSKQGAADHPPQQRLSSGQENGLLLLLGIILLLTFSAARLWSSKSGGEPTK